jgi:3-isopropylmalate dehydrogenase
MRQGIEAALADPASRTPDIRGTGRLSDMVNAILATIEKAA